MLALTQTARLCRYVGQRGGKPAFDTVTARLRCRVHPLEAREAELEIKPAPLTVTTGGATKAYDGTALTNSEATIGGFDGGRAALVFAEVAPVRPGDRLVLEDGGTLTVGKVSEMRGFDRVHHLEIEARSEG